MKRKTKASQSSARKTARPKTKSAEVPRKKTKSVAAKSKKKSSGTVGPAQAKTQHLIEELRHKNRRLELEAHIEAALERVRSRSMAMRQSIELGELSFELVKQVQALGIATWHCAFNIYDEGQESSTEWGSNSDGSYPIYKTPRENIFRRYYDIGTTGIPLHVEVIGEDRCADHYNYLCTLPGVGDTLIKVRDSGIPFPKSQIDHVAYFKYGYLLFITFEPAPEAHDIFKRFAKVFEQTYTRFLDLQKAEGQAREAQIEASLERVRSKTMAMHNSEDVGDTVAILFDELTKLGVKTNRCGIIIFSDTNDTEVWTAKSASSGKVVLIIGHLDVALHPMLTNARNAWKNKAASYSYVMVGEDLINYYTAISTQPGYRMKVNFEALPHKKIHSDFYFPDGAVFAFSSEPIATADAQIFNRLAGVFGQTYRRYLDLQKAEAQAIEATIEASLEKVRGKAMAMHNSSDLIETASLVFTELQKLGINSFQSGVGLLTKEKRNVKLYAASSAEKGTSLSVAGWAVLDHHPVLTKTYDSWINSEDYFPVMKGDILKSYYNEVGPTFTAPVGQQEDYEQHGFFLPFSEGVFYGWSEKPYTASEIRILNRFRGIVDLTFRRYIELQKSEENSKEAIRQASLDRVRAEIASMRTTVDLDRITPLIWKELSILGIPFVRCGVFIMDGQNQQMHTFLSSPDGKAIAAFHLPYGATGNVGDILNHWKKKQTYIRHWDKGAFTELGELLVQQGAIPSIEVYMSTVPTDGIHLHCLPFMQGMLYVGNTTPLQENDIHLIQSVADAFSTAYARYEDFNKLESAKAQIEKTLSDLKLTQNQLVQSEKMASLGQLTAGIAHEIQNPLNFVNNFSEVSNELLEELNEEIQKGNYDEVRSISDNIKQNLEKVIHHGKRADGIVKGMLQHSRSSSSVKEPRDINALADEYLRLAYHGFRAKDKTFNAATHAELDKDIGKINVVPQDIGRVVLNLITNAFYTVTQKQKQSTNAYQPTVSLTTKRHDDCVLISITDNGNGIPENVIDKIFQPFFTTKPTGQGTGLGLSLSYDIVKAHGGELKVETNEGVGSEFVIRLPVS